VISRCRFAAIRDQDVSEAVAKRSDAQQIVSAVIAAAIELRPDTALVMIAERAGVGIASRRARSLPRKRRATHFAAAVRFEVAPPLSATSDTLDARW
jgi:hypothetical protein